MSEWEYVYGQTGGACMSKRELGDYVLRVRPDPVRVSSGMHITIEIPIGSTTRNAGMYGEWEEAEAALAQAVADGTITASPALVEALAKMQKGAAA